MSNAPRQGGGIGTDGGGAKLGGDGGGATALQALAAALPGEGDNAEPSATAETCATAELAQSEGIGSDDGETPKKDFPSK